MSEIDSFERAPDPVARAMASGAFRLQALVVAVCGVVMLPATLIALLVVAL